MNREDITKLAREAGYGWSLTDMHAPALERFAALVAAQEREECAKVCEKESGEFDTVIEALAALTCAAAIRAKGEK